MGGVKVTDTRGNYNEGAMLPEFTDDNVLAMIEYACLDTKLPVPKKILLDHGIRGLQLEGMVERGILARVRVKDSRGNVTPHYYPASFEKYIADRHPPKEFMQFVEDTKQDEHNKK